MINHIIQALVEIHFETVNIKDTGIISALKREKSLSNK